MIDVYSSKQAFITYDTDKLYSMLTAWGPF